MKTIAALLLFIGMVAVHAERISLVGATVINPANGKVMTLLQFNGNEFPNPLTTASCAGYAAPTGSAGAIEPNP